MTTPDKYSLPNMQDLLNGLHGCNVFFKIHVAATDIPKTGIIMPFSLFEYLFLPFGLYRPFSAWWTAPLTVSKGCLHTWTTHRQTHLLHLEAFFNALATNGLAIKLEKCVFAVPSLEILGHTISVTGLTPTAIMPPKLNLAPPPRTSSNCNVFSAW